MTATLSSLSPLSWGEGYNVAKAHQTWWSEHEEFVILTVGIYLCIVFNGPALMARYPPGPLQRAWLKKLFIAWNLSLSVFSWLGLVHVVPHLYKRVSSQGMYLSICADPADWYTRGKVAFWLEMFVMSKFPELMDTVLLVLQGKRVIFLHWYHHTTVLIFCWQAYIRNAGPGLWYCAMNYSVHAFMYLYYAGMAIPSLRRFVSPWSMLITTAQILQMVVGAAVTLSAAWWWLQGTDCHLQQSTCCLGVVMYLSYLGLFVALFVDKYCCCRSKSRGKDPCMGEVSSDSAGMFRAAVPCAQTKPKAAKAA